MMKSGVRVWGHCLLVLAVGWVQGQIQTPQRNFTRPVFHCGGKMSGDSGYIASEGFPSFYKPNSKCTWLITVPEDRVVMLTFRIFDLEADPLCRYDYLDVYNGHSHTVQKLGRFCGTFRPGTLMSTSNTMMLEMASDAGQGGRGFLASFNGVKPHVDELQFCGGKLTKSQGSVKTPNWPEKDYPAGISCSWYISVEPNMVIEVNFDKFDLEADSYCRFDYVAFFNGGEKDNSRLIGKYCGDGVPETIVTSGNELLVQFVSDQSVTSDGFMASYSSIPQGSRAPTAGGSTGQGPRVESAPPKHNNKPIRPEDPKHTDTPKPDVRPEPKPQEPTSAPEAHPGPVPRPKPVKPVKTLRPHMSKPGQNRTRTLEKQPGANRKIVPQNPLCAQSCKRGGTIQTSFCTSEFVITGTVAAMTPGPQGSVSISVSLIKAYKAGRLTITQAGQAMSVKLVSTCKKCPVLSRGMNYILMGQVDEEGRGILIPSSFTLLYKSPHQKLMNNLTKRPC